MSWALLDDNFPNHPKTTAIGRLAVVAYVFGLCYCRKYLTGGFIPEQALKVIGATKADVDKLTTTFPPAESPYWLRVDGGFQIHGYREQYDDAEAKASTDDKRRRRQEAGRKGGLARAAAVVATSKQTTGNASSKEQANGKPIGMDRLGSGLVASGSSEGSTRETIEPLDVEWSRFVAAYPMEGRIASVMAQQMFQSARDSGVTLVSMLEALDNQKASARWLDGKIPNIATWFEGKRWLHRLPPPKAVMGGRTGAAPMGKYDGIEVSD